MNSNKDESTAAVKESTKQVVQKPKRNTRSSTSSNRND